MVGKPEKIELAQEIAGLLAFATFPKTHWRQIWSNNPLERLNKAI